MAFQEITDRDLSEGMHVILQYVASVEPIFFPLMLFCLFLVVAFGSFFATRELAGGRGNLKASFAVAGFVTTSAAYVLSLIPEVVNTTTVVISLVTTILLTLLLFLPKD